MINLDFSNQVAVDGWEVPSAISPNVKANELLINISRRILGPVGTDVLASFGPFQKLARALQ